jgi:hypothetical protein
MSRNLVVRDSAEETFAGLLEHLTRHSPEEGSSTEAGPRFRSGAASRAVPSRGTGAGAGLASSSVSRPPSDEALGTRQPARSLLPVRELNAVRVGSSPDGMPLSYEKALRLHTRHRRVADDDLDLSALDLSELNLPVLGSRTGRSSELPPVAAGCPPGSQTEQKAGARTAQPQAPHVQTSQSQTSQSRTLQSQTLQSGVSQAPARAHIQNTGARNAAPRSTRNIASVAPRVAKASGSASPAHPPVAATAKAADASPLAPPKLASVPTPASTPPARLQKPRTAQPAQSAQRRPVQVKREAAIPSTPSAAKEPGVAVKLKRAPRSAVEWQSTSGFEEQRHAIASTIVPRGRPDRRPAQIETRQLEVQTTHAQPSHLEQRRTIVSLRLTEGEMKRLRDRADESGISVSAYMRSCVMEADQLRAQVKRALAEMRAVSMGPNADHFPTMAQVRSTATTQSGTWFQLLVRTAAVFLSPLFPGRRTTSLARTEVDRRP